MNGSEFLAEVKHKGGFSTDEETLEVVSHVLMAMGEALPEVALGRSGRGYPENCWSIWGRTRNQTRTSTASCSWAGLRRQ